MTESPVLPPDLRPPARKPVPYGFSEQVVGRLSTIEQPSRRGRVLAPALAAATLTVTAVALTQLVPNSTQPAPGAPPSSSAPTSAPASAPASGLSTSPADMLTAVAQNAGKQAPLALGPSQFLHVTSSESESGQVVRTRDEYVAADGWTWMHQVADGHQNWSIYNSADDGELQIGQYPTDPGALEAHFRKVGGNASSDQDVWVGVSNLLTHPLLSPQQRQAAILVLQRVAQHPQAPASAQGDPNAERSPSGIATPTITITAVSLPGGGTGYRATFTDQTQGEDTTESVLLDSNGNAVQMASGQQSVTLDGGDVVDQLPAEFVDKLGTKRVEKSVDE